MPCSAVSLARGAGHNVFLTKNGRTASKTEVFDDFIRVIYAIEPAKLSMYIGYMLGHAPLFDGHLYDLPCDFGAKSIVALEISSELALTFYMEPDITPTALEVFKAALAHISLAPWYWVTRRSCVPVGRGKADQPWCRSSSVIFRVITKGKEQSRPVTKTLLNLFNTDGKISRCADDSVTLLEIKENMLGKSKMDLRMAIRIQIRPSKLPIRALLLFATFYVAMDTQRVFESVCRFVVRPAADGEGMEYIWILKERLIPKPDYFAEISAARALTSEMLQVLSYQGIPYGAVSMAIIDPLTFVGNYLEAIDPARISVSKNFIVNTNVIVLDRSSANGCAPQVQLASGLEVPRAALHDAELEAGQFAVHPAGSEVQRAAVSGEGLEMQKDVANGDELEGQKGAASGDELEMQRDVANGDELKLQKIAVHEAGLGVPEDSAKDAEFEGQMATTAHDNGIEAHIVHSKGTEAHVVHNGEIEARKAEAQPGGNPTMAEQNAGSVEQLLDQIEQKSLQLPIFEPCRHIFSPARSGEVILISVQLPASSARDSSWFDKLLEVLGQPVFSQVCRVDWPRPLELVISAEKSISFTKLGEVRRILRQKLGVTGTARTSNASFQS